MPGDSTSTNTLEVTLKSLKLRPGMLLQIQPMHDGAAWVEAQFLAGLPGKGIMTAPHNINYEMKAGVDFSIRGFTGQHDFEFASRVLQSFTDPFPYALLCYPDKVEARVVRKAMRMKAQLPATAARQGKPALPVHLIDLSVAGAMIQSSQALGTTGDQLDLGFSLVVENNTMNFQLVAQIAHSTEADDGFRLGLMFKNITQNDKLALHYFAASSAEDNLAT